MPSLKDFEHFVLAQAPVYPQVLMELRHGEKNSHWMWFIFPQLAGLGSSPLARKFALRSLDDARLYLAHPLLGSRLIECAGLALAIQGKSAVEVFGGIDSIKLRSSATLFGEVSQPGSVFHRLLEHYFDGTRDPETLRLLKDGRDGDTDG